MCCILVGNGPEKQYPTEYDYPYITLQLQQFLRLDCIWVWYRLVGSKQLLNSPYRLEGTVHDVSKEFIASSGIFVTEFPRTCIPSPRSWPPQKPWFSGRWWWNHIFATSYLIFRWFEGWELLSSLQRRWDPTSLRKNPHEAGVWNDGGSPGVALGTLGLWEPQSLWLISWKL